MRDEVFDMIKDKKRLGFVMMLLCVLCLGGCKNKEEAVDTVAETTIKQTLVADAEMKETVAAAEGSEKETEEVKETEETTATIEETVAAGTAEGTKAAGDMETNADADKEPVKKDDSTTDTKDDNKKDENKTDNSSDNATDSKPTDNKPADNSTDGSNATPAPSASEVTPNHTHSFVAESKAASCTEDGYTREVCSCGEVRNQVVVTCLGHDFSELVYFNVPTCTSAGYGWYECSKCGQAQGDAMFPIEELPHTVAEKTIFSGDCANPKQVEQYCSVCNAKLGSYTTDSENPEEHDIRTGSGQIWNAEKECVMNYTQTWCAKCHKEFEYSETPVEYDD